MLTIGLPEFIQEPPDRTFWGQFNTMNRVSNRNPVGRGDSLPQAFGDTGIPALEDKVTGQTCQQGTMLRTIITSIQATDQAHCWIVVGQRLVYIPQQIFQTIAAYTVAGVKVDLHGFF